MKITFKKIFIVSSLVFFSFVFANNAFAAMISTSDLTPRSVTINAIELTPNNTFIFQITSANFKTLEIPGTAGLGGTASVPFSGLLPNKSYTAIVSKYDEAKKSLVAVAPVIYFTTPTSFTVEKLTATTATLKATDLIPNEVYLFEISTPSGLKVAQATADSTGTVLGPFFALTPNRSYTASISRYNPVTHAKASAGLQPITFSTPSPKITISDLAPTSVTLHADGLIRDVEYMFTIQDSSGNPFFSKVTAGSSDGLAQGSIAGLTPNKSYTAYISLYSASSPTTAGLPPLYFATPAFEPGQGDLPPGWYYEMNDDSGTRLVGPNTAEDCQTDLDDQVSKGALIIKQCYEVGQGSENNWYVQYKGTAPDTNTVKTDGPYDQSTCEFRAETLQVNKATIVKNCYKSATSPTLSTPSTSQEDRGNGLVPCTDDCGWDDLMKLIATVIDFLIFYLSLPIAAIAFAYSGWLFMTSGDNPGNRTKAIDIFKKVALGLVIAMAAWLIVSTIITTLVKTELIDDYSLLEGIK